MKKKIIASILVVFSLFAFVKRQAFAAEYGEACTNNNQCTTGLCRPNGYCGCTSNSHCTPPTYCHADNSCRVINNLDDWDPVSNPIFGNIDAPPGVAELNQQAGGIGIILFFSNMIKLITIIAGLWAMFNFILAGFTYVTSADDPGKIEKIGTKLTLSVVGIAIIVASYTMAALLGLILFGDATFIISPKIPSAIL